MNGTSARQLGAVLPKPPPLPVGVPAVAGNWALVQSIQYGPPLSLTITLGGSSVGVAGIRCLDSYHPTAGDMVMVDHIGSDLVVMGSVSGAGGPGLAQTLGHAEVTATSAGFTATTAIAGLSKAVTVGVSRLIVLPIKTRVTSTVAGDITTIYALRDGVIFDANDYLIQGGAAVPQFFEVQDKAPVAGAHTYSVSATRAAGTGTLTNAASATKSSFLRVEDRGPN